MKRRNPDLSPNERDALRYMQREYTEGVRRYWPETQAERDTFASLEGRGLVDSEYDDDDDLYYWITDEGRAFKLGENPAASPHFAGAEYGEEAAERAFGERESIRGRKRARKRMKKNAGHKKYSKKNIAGVEVDETAGEELKLYIDNDGDLYRQQTTPIHKNLVTKMAQKRYSPQLARELFGYLVESGAKKYVREFDPSTPWHVMFDVPTRAYVADRLASDFEAEAKLGNYDHLLPKKYQTRHNPKAKNPSALDPKKVARLLNPWG